MNWFEILVLVGIFLNVIVWVILLNEISGGIEAIKFKLHEMNSKIEMARQDMNRKQNYLAWE